MTPMPAPPPCGDLRVSDNRRFLVRADGRPFFWLGDTAWQLFHDLNREEAEFYLRVRAAQGFNVIQAVVLAEHGGRDVPNAYGHLSLQDNDPTRPNEGYFEHVDWIVATAERLGLYVGMLPTWGSYVIQAPWSKHIRPIFTEENAAVYGKWLGRRYGGCPNLVWILGGDRVADGVVNVWRAMANGLRESDGGRHLITFHPAGGNTSARWVHDETWLDFNMIQSGHACRCGRNWEMIAADYARRPVKPVLDGEPIYEDHPFGQQPANGYSDDHDVRQAAYWAVFSGAPGHTYGCHDIWMMNRPDRHWVATGRMHWREALHLPGALDMRHVRRLMESRPFLTRFPDPSLVRNPGCDWDHAAATRDGTPGQSDATFLMVYTPVVRHLVVQTSAIPARRLRTWWYDVREGLALDAGERDNPGELGLRPPAYGPDWALVIDDASAGYAPPGQGA